MPCPLCNDTGFKNVKFGPELRYTGVAKCDCRKQMEAAQPGGFSDIGSFTHPLIDSLKESENQKMDQSENPSRASDAEIERGGGIEYAAARAAMLQQPDREIAAIILNHRGKKNAVTIEDICKLLWLEKWFGQVEGCNPADESQVYRLRNQLVRTVKASVERIRTEGRIPVAAHKGNPGGYYIPVTAEECDECHDRLFGEGIKLIRLSQLFKPDADLAAELRGQLRMTNCE